MITPDWQQCADHWGADGHVGELLCCGCELHHCYQKGRLIHREMVCPQHVERPDSAYCRRYHEGGQHVIAVDCGP